MLTPSQRRTHRSWTRQREVPPNTSPQSRRRRTPTAAQLGAPLHGVAHRWRETGQSREPGYLTETGEAAGDDGSVAPIIGGLPAVEGSSWDIGAPAEERGANLADEQPRSRPDQAGGEETPSG